MGSGESAGAKDVSKHSPRTIILLGGGLLLSVSAILLGAYFLILAFAVILPVYDNYWAAILCGSIGLGLVLLLAGILGLRACIRRSKAMRRERA